MTEQDESKDRAYEAFQRASQISRKQRLKLHERRSKRIQQMITFTSTFVAVAAGVTGVWSGFEAHTARVADERPYLGFQVSSSYEAMSAGLSVNMTASGKSPATKIEVKCLVQSTHDDPSWNSLRQVQMYGHKYMIPGQTEFVQCVSAQDKDDFTVYGIARYQDSEHSKYQTPFCFKVTAHIPTIPTSIPCSLPDEPEIQ